MRTLFAIAVAVAQFAVLAYMAGEREWVLRTGRPVYLRTAPVDPQDPMRGDYVHLTYEVSSIPRRLCRDGIPAWLSSNERDVYRSSFRDRRVYAEIRLDEERVADVVSLSDRRPSEGLFLAGRVNTVYADSVDVRFGVEAFFTQQGRAKEFEDARRGDKAGVPLNMEMAVSPSGLAVLKGYRWEPLGLTLTLDRPPEISRTESSRERLGVLGASVELKNHGTMPLAIVAGPRGTGFHLVPQRTSFGSEERVWVWMGEGVLASKPSSEEVRLLKSGESYRVHLDFSSADWFVRRVDGKAAPGEPTSLTKLGNEWAASFRIDYVPPPAADCAGLPHAEQIRHTTVRSRAFSPAGARD